MVDAIDSDSPTKNRVSREGHHSVTFDPREESASNLLIRTVAAIENDVPEDLPVLHDYIDPDAVDTLIGSSIDKENPGHDHTVAFRYDKYLVHINSSGIITLSSADSK